MKNIFKPRFIISSIIVAISGIIIGISAPMIKLDTSIQALIPHDEKMQRSLELTQLSPVADKVILFVEVDNAAKLSDIINQIEQMVNKVNFTPKKISFGNFEKILQKLDENQKQILIKSYKKGKHSYTINKLIKEEKNAIDLLFKNVNFTLKSAIPDQNDIFEIMDYASTNSLLLYPYEFLENPFSKEKIKEGFVKKVNYIESSPFFTANEAFFLDPVMMGFSVLKLANSGTSGKYFPQYGGVVSDDKKSYIKVFKANFSPDDYENSEKLYNLNKDIEKFAKKDNFKGFLYSPHLYYSESFKSIQIEIGFIFILSIFLTLLVFYVFFNRISILLYGLVPIIGGFALTFFIIAVFKKTYGGIAFAFGSTTAGIAIDYTVHYLSKLCVYPTLKELRQKIGISMILGYLTTISAFILLIFSNIISLQEIGLFGFLGISFSFLLNWFVLQKIIPPEQYSCHIKKINLPQFGKKSFIVWLVVFAVIIIGALFTKFEDNIRNLDKNHKILDNKIKIIQNKFKESTDSVFLVFTGNTREDMIKKSFLAYKTIYQNNKDLLFLSPSIFMLSEANIKNHKNFIKNNFNQDFFNEELKNSIFTDDTFSLWVENIKNINDLILTKMPDYIAEEIESMFVDLRGQEYLLIHINSRERAKQISNILTKEKVDFFMSDALMDSAKSLVEFEKKALILVFSALIIIFVILLIAYRNPIYSLLAILPPVAALITGFSVAFFTGRGFNIMHLTSSILLLGIAVDYGIFVTTAFKNNYDKEEILATFKSVFVCALTTLAGFGVLSLSSNQAIFSLGTSMFAGVIFALATAYIAIPNLARMIKKG